MLPHHRTSRPQLTRAFAAVLLTGILFLLSAMVMAQEPKELPNIFTPNGDGLNDYFVLEGTQPITLTVFNRNGMVVYQTQGLLIKWDGKDHLGREVADGIYFYTLDDPAGTYKKKRGMFCISREAMRKAE